MKKAYVVAGLGYGDEGKGATVDFICRTRKVGLVVRYNGGPQAGHNVVTPEGNHHTFSQFGSGSFIGVPTYLGPEMLVNPISAAVEAKHLEEVGVTNPFSRLIVDHRCVIVTPFHRAANRIEQLAKGAHNSCGQGIGETRGYSIIYPETTLRVRDLTNSKETKHKLRAIQDICLSKSVINHPELFDHEEMVVLRDKKAVDWCMEQYKAIPWQVDGTYGNFMYDMTLNIVFEGAQGVLLDENFGEDGYNTWSDTTFNDAKKMLRSICADYRPCFIGVTRTYSTRHGDGPFLVSAKEMVDYSERLLPEPHNASDKEQGEFRRGRFNMIATRYAILACGGVDGIALNHLDCFPGFGTEWLTNQTRVPVLIEGRGPTANHRLWTKEGREL